MKNSLDLEPVLSVYIDLTDQYLGELIEEVIERYYPDIIEIVDFEDLLEYITLKIMNGNKRLNNYEEYQKLLRRLLRNKQIAKTLISYLISKYLEENIDQSEDI